MGRRTGVDVEVLVLSPCQLPPASWPPGSAGQPRRRTRRSLGATASRRVRTVRLGVLMRRRRPDTPAVASAAGEGAVALKRGRSLRRPPAVRRVGPRSALVRRLMGLGLLVGLFVMHGISATGPTAALAYPHEHSAPGHASSEGAERCEHQHCDDGQAPAHAPCLPSHALCAAVMTGATTAGVPWGGALPVALDVLPADAASPTGSGERASCERPPDLAALCVLRI